MNATHAHIVVIRRGDVVEGHQLRINGGGTGLSKFFGAGRYGSPEKARRAAEKEARALGLPKTGRGGSTQGRVLSTSLTGSAGIRFSWSTEAAEPRLRVVASWVDKQGRPRQTSFSVQRNGLMGALDKAIEARTSCGAPVPDRVALLRLLRREQRTQSQLVG